MEAYITGIRYQMPGPTKDEKTAQAEQLTRHTPIGTRVLLKCEPDNPLNRMAIAVYLRWKRIGYIANEYLTALHPLVSERRLVEAVITGTDGHVTMWCEVDDVPEAVHTASPGQRKIEASPLPDSCTLPYTPDEHELELIASILTQDPVWSGTLTELLEAVDFYLPRAKLSITADDAHYQRQVQQRLEAKAVDTQITDTEREALHERIRQLKSIIGDMHRQGGYGQILQAQIVRVRQQAQVLSQCYGRFDQYYFRTPIEEASAEAISAEHQRLTDWLDRIPEGIFRPAERDYQYIGAKLRYQDLTRGEIYDIISVLLHAERLDATLCQRHTPAPAEAPIPETPDNETPTPEVETPIDPPADLTGYDTLAELLSNEIIDSQARFDAFCLGIVQTSRLVQKGQGDKTRWSHCYRVCYDEGLIRPTQLCKAQFAQGIYEVLLHAGATEFWQNKKQIESNLSYSTDMHSARYPYRQLSPRDWNRDCCLAIAQCFG